MSAVTVSNFIDGQPWQATAGDVKASWNGSPDRFRCGLCGHKFEIGDTVRFQYMKSAPNFLVCASCDGADVQERFNQRYQEAKAFAQRVGWI